MPSQYVIRTRLIILFFTLLSLAVAGLNSANAHFSIILRDRARSDYTNTPNGILDNAFERLQSKALNVTVLTALASTAVTVYGAVIMSHSRWLRDHEGTIFAFAIFQVILAFIMIVTGGYLADNVRGFYTSFENFASHDSIPYYSLMYYGGVAQAAYGSVLVFLAITVVVLLFAYDRYENEKDWNEAAASEEAASNSFSSSITK
ncbi:hypothetical protein O988_02797 [Pseudogymnoascus sp. VKM F-3808]|nr:hypothetical protein O988_02797 [Pseudogymnoascus sp. VKM F-3808]